MYVETIVAYNTTIPDKLTFLTQGIKDERTAFYLEILAVMLLARAISLSMMTKEMRRRVQRARICWQTASRKAAGPWGSSPIISAMVALVMTSRARLMMSRSRSPIRLAGMSREGS